MRRLIFLLFGLAVCTPAHAQTTAPSSHARRVLVISIDGGRPDVILRANTPHIRALLADGSFTFWARTTSMSVTLPSHVSMVTGVTPDKHGIDWNKDLPEHELRYPNYPTIFELAKEKGMTTAMAGGKSKLIAIARPGSIDHYLVPDEGSFSDEAVAFLASQSIRVHRPQVMLVHLPGPDSAGHASGWGSPQQLAAIELADAGVGRIVSTLKELDLYPSTLIIVSADHGGAARSHGKDDPRSRHIPWIAVGPGIRRNFDLTTFKDLTINTEDTFATACAFMGIAPGDDIDGKPITQMLEGAELMQSTTRPAKEPATGPVTRPVATSAR